MADGKSIRQAAMSCSVAFFDAAASLHLDRPLGYGRAHFSATIHLNDSVFAFQSKVSIHQNITATPILHPSCAAVIRDCCHP
jgi:hypothetical protein